MHGAFCNRNRLQGTKGGGGKRFLFRIPLRSAGLKPVLASPRPFAVAGTQMHKKFTVYQKPTSSKCRATLRLLKERGVEEFEAIML